MLDVANYSDNVICVLRAMMNETSWMLNREHKPNADLLKNLRAHVNGERRRRGLAKIKVGDGVKYDGPDKFNLNDATDNEVIYIDILADTIIDFSMLGSGVRKCATLIGSVASRELKERNLSGVPLMEEFMADVEEYRSENRHIQESKDCNTTAWERWVVQVRNWLR